MHDEACPTYLDMLDNTALGARLIFDSFRVSPRTTWSIDPFGHSAFQGSMLSSPLAGVNGVYVARMDYQDVAAREKSPAFKGTEMFWAPSPSQPLQGGVLGFLPFWYYAPGGFDFGGDDGTQPVMDDPALEDYNVADVVARFNALIDTQTNFTAGGDVMIVMATDFSGENAPTWYRNIDKLIHWVNLEGGPGGGGKYHALYSTPSAYTAAKAAGAALPLRTEDVMPYADGPHAFWSGYFSSRPALKGYVRDSSALFQAAKQMVVAAGAARGGALPPPDDAAANGLFLLERALGVTQHHDAVSGTSKQHVAYDYARRLAGGRLAADAAAAAALGALTGEGAAAPWASCDLTNATICPALEGGGAVALLLWNQQAAPLVGARVRVPVRGQGAAYGVRGGDLAPLPAQVFPLSAADGALRTGYYAHGGPAVQWLAFQVPLVPAMGYAVVFIEPAGGAEAAPAARAPAPGLVSNGLVNLTYGADGRLAALASAATGGAPLPLELGFFYYNSSTGNFADNSSDAGQKSGAYIFRPNSSTLFPVGAGPVAAELAAAGPVVWEVRQAFAPWATLVTRLWAGSDEVEVEYTVGPVPVNGAANPDGEGREVVLRYASGLASNATWVSDSNGRDALTRVRDFRRSWAYEVIEPVAGNYVPVNLFQSLADSATGLALSVAVDRTQAGSSMADGALDFMVHRRLTRDDDRGVGEALNETGLDGRGLVVRGTHRARVAARAGAGAALRASAADALLRPVAVFQPLAGGADAWAAAFAANASALRMPLPRNAHVATLQALGGDVLLVRIAHTFAAGEDAALSAPVSVDLATLLRGRDIAACTETILTGTIALADAPSTTYTTTEGDVVTLPVVFPAPAGAALTVTLSAMQIRTFKCTLAAA